MNKDFENVKKSLQNANKVADVKRNLFVDSVVMSAVRAVPIIGDMLDSSMNKIIEDFQKKKEEELVDVILRDKNSITTEMINNIEFIINFAKTKEAVRRLATNEKVEYFGNLIRNGYLSGERIDDSEFEEYLDILNSMSYREIEFLSRYKLFCEKKCKKIKGLDSEWQLFLNDYTDGMDIQEQEKVVFMLPKLTRTGFIEEIYETTEGELNTENDMMRVESSRVKKVGYKLTTSFDRFYEITLKRIS